MPKSYARRVNARRITRVTAPTEREGAAVAGMAIPSKTGTSALRGLCVSAAFLTFGCAVGPDFVRPHPPSAERYTHGPVPTATVAADGVAQRFEGGAKVAADWWKLFQSPELDAVVSEAISNNATLQAAQAALRQSEDSLRAGYGVFFPQLDANLGATRQKFSPARFGGSAPSSIFNLFTLGATVSYALDVFGVEQRTVEGLQAQVDVQQYMVLATYLTLTGNVANTLIARSAYRDQIKATADVIRSLQEQVGVAEVQVEAGTASYTTLLSLQSQLASFQATIPPLRQSLAKTESLLATLVGRTPAEWSPPDVELSALALPRDLPVTLPSELVRQRPDILVAEARLHSASANVGVATAALFPNFALSGSYGQTSNATSSLFQSNANVWSLGAAVAGPLFHGGTLWFQRRAAIDAYDQSLAIYRQTVLSGLAQVGDALRALEHDAEALDASSRNLRAAGDVLPLVEANYIAGTVNYLGLLVANAQFLQAKIAYLQTLAQRYQDTVALFVALGGGWWNEAPVSPDAASTTNALRAVDPSIDGVSGDAMSGRAAADAQANDSQRLKR